MQERCDMSSLNGGKSSSDGNLNINIIYMSTLDLYKRNSS